MIMIILTAILEGIEKSKINDLCNQSKWFSIFVKFSHMYSRSRFNSGSEVLTTVTY